MATFSKKRLKELERLETEDTKFCAGCKKILPLFEFNINSNGRKFAQAICIKCTNEKDMLRNRGITLKQYDKLLEKQNNKCKICGTKIPGGRGRFHIDHNHSTGKIRGLLCMNCNRMLGHAKDNIEVLAKAIIYLKGEE